MAPVLLIVGPDPLLCDREVEARITQLAADGPPCRCSDWTRPG
jgi:hypothetical protein